MAKDKEVIVYSTPYCVFCKHVKEYLDSHKVAWREIDVSSDPQAAEEMIKKSGQMGVPVTDFRGEIVIGFNKAKLDQLITT